MCSGIALAIASDATEKYFSARGPVSESAIRRVDSAHRGIASLSACLFADHPF
jgi:hypothetical protein